MVSKSKSRTPAESTLVLPRHPDLSPDSNAELVDTHTHLLSTYIEYVRKYQDRSHATISQFVKALLLSDQSQKVAKIVDVWCEAPLITSPSWRDLVEELSGVDGFDYRFVIGAHPHEAKNYTDELEATYKEAHGHPRCVGWGEIGLDYHYDNSPRELQQAVLRRQLKAALQSGQDKAITIHTREADEDIYKILTEELPREQRFHVHCFTDSPELAHKLLSHFENCFIGITGVVTYSSNENTSNVIRAMGENATVDSPENLRILLETDAPYMIPSTLGPPTSLGMKGGQKLPFCHGGTLPWTAAFIAKVLNERETLPKPWTTEDVIRVCRNNARKVYGI